MFLVFFNVFPVFIDEFCTDDFELSMDTSPITGFFISLYISSKDITLSGSNT